MTKQTKSLRKTRKHFGGTLTKNNILETLEKFLSIKPLMEKKFPKVDYVETPDEKFLKVVWLAKEIVKGGSIKKQLFKWHPDKNVNIEPKKYTYIVEEIFKIYNYIPDILEHAQEFKDGKDMSKEIQADNDWQQSFFIKVEKLLHLTHNPEEIEVATTTRKKKPEAADKPATAEEKKPSAEEKKPATAEEKKPSAEEKKPSVEEKNTTRKRRRSITDSKNNSDKKPKSSTEPSSNMFSSLYEKIVKIFKKENKTLMISDKQQEEIQQMIVKQYEDQLKREKEDEDEKIRKHYEKKFKHWKEEQDKMYEKEAATEKERKDDIQKRIKAIPSRGDYSRIEFEERMEKDRKAEAEEAKNKKPKWDKPDPNIKKPPDWI